MEAHRKIKKKFSIIHIPVLSFFSKELYIDVGQNWKGVNFSYLLLLLAICWIPTMIKVHIDFSNVINNEAPAIVNQVPEITITDGQVSIKETQPYYIKDPDSNEPLAIIDTTGQIESLEDANAFCLLTKTKIMWQKSEVETQIFDLSKIEHFVLDSERITSWLQIGRKFLAVVIYPFALLGSYVYRIVQALIYAAIGLLFASFCKTTLSYAALIRLAVVAVTPCIIVGTILGLTDASMPAFLYPVAALVYLFFAVKSFSGIPEVHEDEGQITGREGTVWNKSSDQ